MRKSGYYRVKLNGVWTIAEYDFGTWYIRRDRYGDSEFDEIFETPINPKPKKYKN